MTGWSTNPSKEPQVNEESMQRLGSSLGFSRVSGWVAEWLIVAALGGRVVASGVAGERGQVVERTDDGLTGAIRAVRLIRRASRGAQ
jgi:hypothetical protein